jgi:hypothetical protein
MSSNELTKVGEIRPSQLVFGFGVGSLVDLPNFSAIVSGLEFWDTRQTQVLHEPRLLRAVRGMLGKHVSQLRHPPVFESKGKAPPAYSPSAGVPVATFPRWMVCPECHVLAPCSEFKRELDGYSPNKSRYLHENCQNAKHAPVVFPVRFLVTCANGHLDDFPWHRFVHRGESDCHGPLSFEEWSVTSEARDIFVKCRGCGVKARPMLDALSEGGRAFLGDCSKRHPHLRCYDEERCEAPPRVILLGASNLWFPASVSVLHVPRSKDAEENAIAEQSEKLAAIDSIEKLVEFIEYTRQGRKFGNCDEALLETLERIPAIKVFRVLEDIKKEEASDLSPSEIKNLEFDTFCRASEAPRSDDFDITEVARIHEAGISRKIARVVRADRLREVRALTGFFRLEAPGELNEIQGDEGRSYVRLSQEPSRWVPAVEVRGEGLFLQVDETALQEWLSRPAVIERGNQILQGHIAWRRARGIEHPEADFPGMRFILLHSLSHALMRQICLACGYAAASIRERIYSAEREADRAAMAGILIYTSASDSEGTLGGLVNAASTKEFRRHLELAIDEAGLCGSDPLCAEHNPGDDGSLHGAACHSCLLAPETSCEKSNRYLDRSLLAPSLLAAKDLAFF